jgi:hypothetical protein
LAETKSDFVENQVEHRHEAKEAGYEQYLRERFDHFGRQPM